MKKIFIMVSILIVIQAHLYADRNVKKGKLIQKDGKSYIIDDKGNKSKILQGKELAEVFFQWGINEIKNKNYTMANTRFEEALTIVYSSNVQDESFIFNIIQKAKKNESSAPKELSFKQKQNFNFYSSLYFYFGGTYLSQKDYKSSIYYFKKAIYYNPQNIKPYNNLGIAYDLLKEYDLAIKTYMEGIKIAPKENSIYFNLACSYSLQNKKTESLDNLEKAISYGFRNKESIINDKTLENIRNTKRFKELINTLN